MTQQKLMLTQVENEVAPPVRRGPPNRMNDLDYSTWMKFQKSFFWFDSLQTVVDDCIYFFTKSVWNNDAPSRSLIISESPYHSSIPAPRQIQEIRASNVEEICSTLLTLSQETKKYDFLLIDLTALITTSEDLHNFLAQYSERMFSAMRDALVRDRYCAILIGNVDSGGRGFPIPWSIGNASRRYLKLKDEKVGLVKEEKSVIYCLFMQAQDDEFYSDTISPENLCIDQDGVDIPAWIFPKSPPRKKNEILHPAKYPETLVAPFIELFTQPGDTVLDPMVGTGSTVIAALRCGRNGFGIDLVQEFVDIARARISEEMQPMLFAEFQTNREATVICGDSTRLSENSALNGHTFDYAITSPPYWSMLSNPGSENQEARRQKQLRLVYSDAGSDLGNVSDYEDFITMLGEVYSQVATKLVTGGHLTVVVKNVKRDHTLYTLAWDLTRTLCRPDSLYNYVGCTLWCQDDIALKPFAVGTHWVSNTLHNYCLHFRKR